MNLNIPNKRSGALVVFAALAFLVFAAAAHAAVEGVSGTSPNPVFNLTAKADYISVPEGSRIFMWGYGVTGANMQYPGPTIIVNQNDSVTVNLTNKIGGVPVSIVFAGQDDVAATGGVQGMLAREARFGETVTYTFTASRPGTFTYFSGSMPELATEMGLVGTLIVRPVDGGGSPIPGQAYNDVSSAFDQEFLFFLTEMDPNVHFLVEKGRMAEVDLTDYFPVIWFINGRAAPDTMLDAHSPILPNQPYNCFPMTHPNERLLMRIVGGGRDLHPYHAHGNHSRVIARDGRLLESTPGVSGANTGAFNFTNSSIPGSTIDAIFTWSGNNIGWDIYNHAITDPMNPALGEVFVSSTVPAGLAAGPGPASLDVAGGDGTLFPLAAAFRAVIWPAGEAFDAKTSYEVLRIKHDMTTADTFTIVDRGLEGTTQAAWNAGDNIAFTDHGAPFPVIIPSQEVLTYGQFYSGSPFLGSLGQLPPGEGGFNPNGGFFYMWHSHNEKEITSFDVFPGGMLTMMIIENPLVPLVTP